MWRARYNGILQKGIWIMMVKILNRTDMVSFFYILSICLAMVALLLLIKNIDGRVVFALFCFAVSSLCFGRFFELGEDDEEYEDDEEDW
jgi:hypothetical protein